MKHIVLSLNYGYFLLHEVAQNAWCLVPTICRKKQMEFVHDSWLRKPEHGEYSKLIFLGSCGMWDKRLEYLLKML